MIRSPVVAIVFGNSKALNKGKFDALALVNFASDLVARWVVDFGVCCLISEHEADPQNMRRQVSRTAPPSTITSGRAVLPSCHSHYSKGKFVSVIAPSFLLLFFSSLLLFLCQSFECVTFPSLLVGAFLFYSRGYSAFHSFRIERSWTTLLSFPKSKDAGRRFPPTSV
jgi:hypothetical protein